MRSTLPSGAHTYGGFGIAADPVLSLWCRMLSASCQLLSAVLPWRGYETGDSKAYVGPSDQAARAQTFRADFDWDLIGADCDTDLRAARAADAGRPHIEVLLEQVADRESLRNTGEPARIGMAVV